MKRFTLMLAVLTFSCYNMHGQVDIGSGHVSLYANFSAPSAALKKAVDNNVGGMGVGINCAFVVNPFGKRKPSPMYVGLDLGYLTFGRDKIAETATAPPYKTSFNYYNVGALGRLFPFTRREGITPFVDGMVGVKIMNARTKIDKDAFDTIDDSQPVVINSTNDAGLGYGIGLGFYNRRYNEVNGERIGKGSFSLRVMYLWGDDTRYVKRKSLTVDNGFVDFEQGYTRTDMLVIQLGVYVF